MTLQHCNGEILQVISTPIYNPIKINFLDMIYTDVKTMEGSACCFHVRSNLGLNLRFFFSGNESVGYFMNVLWHVFKWYITDNVIFFTIPSSNPRREREIEIVHTNIDERFLKYLWKIDNSDKNTHVTPSFHRHPPISQNKFIFKNFDGSQEKYALLSLVILMTSKTIIAKSWLFNKKHRFWRSLSTIACR